MAGTSFYSNSGDNNLTATGLTLAATGNLFEGNIDNLDRIAFQLTGTWVGTVLFEQSNDATNWVSCSGYIPSAPATETVVSLTANGALVCRSDMKYGRVRVSAYTSGTIACVVHGRRIGTFNQ
tara:strand:+ start:2312 stop:2680 length:369 start_codon:yes stop_codon:yes gene_type:complete